MDTRKLLPTLMMAASAAVFLTAGIGCDDDPDSPGEAVDQAIDNTKDASHDAADKIEDAGDKAADNIHDATH